MRRALRGPGGFTLLELVVVLAVLATVTALALPSIRRGSQNLQLRAGAGRVASLLREARLQAVTYRRPTRVALEPSHRGAALGWDGTNEPLRVEPDSEVEQFGRKKNDPADDGGQDRRADTITAT